MYEKLLRHIISLNHWRKQKVSQDNFLIVAACIVGAFGGLAASLLKKLTHAIASFLQNDFHWPYKYYLYLFFPLIGILLTVLYIKVFIRKKAFRHGIPPLIKSVTAERSKLDFHNIYSQVISSALTVGMGGSAGLEAPAVASGSAIGSNIGRVFGLNYRETTLLLACGAAAGISGAFGSPIAGMIFAIEVILPSFSIPAFVPLLIASAMASVVSKLLHSEPLFLYVSNDWQLNDFGFYLLFGLLAGLYSVYFSLLNEKAHQYFDKIKGTFTKVGLGGAILGLLVAFFPAVYGEGYITIQNFLEGNYSSLLSNSFFASYNQNTWLLVLFALLTLVAKTIGSVVTMSSGGNGGMFGPSVVVGGLLGFVFAFGLNLTGWTTLNVTHFIIAGMAASVAGVMHAPLTGVFLSAEITGGYTLIVPLMSVSAISFFVNKRVRKYSIYTKKLAEQGNLLSNENTDEHILMHLKLKSLLEKNYVVLLAADSPHEYKEAIVRSEKNVFPVVDGQQKLIGVLGMEQLLEFFVDPGLGKTTCADLVQPSDEWVGVDTPLREAIQLMDKKNIRILAVVDQENRYLGFVSKNGIFIKYRKLLIKQDAML